MARTALVTGASGFLGRQITKTFQLAGWNTIGTGLMRADPPAILKVDLTDSNQVSKVLDEVKPDVVVHSAANRFPDKCDADPQNARTTNVEASKYLALACARQNILLLYISTDYVFPGKAGDAPYEADAQPAPTNLYGQTKLEGERATLEATQEKGLGVVLRVPVLYGKANEPNESAVNILMDVLWKSQEKDAKVKMDDWAKRYPTNTEDVARVCLDISTLYLGDPDARQGLPKILQFSSEDKMTKYEICQVFAEIMGLPLDGILADRQGPDPSAGVQRPMDTHLSTRVLQDIGVNVATENFKAWWSVSHQAWKQLNNLAIGDGS